MQRKIHWKSARVARFHALNSYDALKRYYSIITHAHTFHGDVNARRYFSVSGTIPSEGTNKREETAAAKDTRCERIGTWQRGRSLHSGRIRDTKRVFSPTAAAAATTSSSFYLCCTDGDCKRTRRSEMAPLTSDAPNAIRTTLSRNISQIGVKRLAAGRRTGETRKAGRGLLYSRSISK